MRVSFFTIIMILLPNIIIGQCCPYLDSVQIIPDNPNDVEETSVILTVTTPNQGSFISAMSEVDGFNITITACYYSGFLTALQTYVDTVSLGVLPAGNYEYEFTAQQSDSFEFCNVTDSQVQIDDFEVEMVNSISNNETSNLLIYPNPVQDNLLRIEGQGGIQMLEICDCNGKVVIQNTSNFTNNKAEINLEGLASGIYLLKVLFVDGERSTSKIVIE